MSNTALKVAPESQELPLEEAVRQYIKLGEEASKLDKQRKEFRKHIDAEMAKHPENNFKVGNFEVNLNIGEPKEDFDFDTAKATLGLNVLKPFITIKPGQPRLTAKIVKG